MRHKSILLPIAFVLLRILSVSSQSSKYEEIKNKYDQYTAFLLEHLEYDDDELEMTAKLAKFGAGLIEAFDAPGKIVAETLKLSIDMTTPEGHLIKQIHKDIANRMHKLSYEMMDMEVRITEILLEKEFNDRVIEPLEMVTLTYRAFYHPLGDQELARRDYPIQCETIRKGRTLDYLEEVFVDNCKLSTNELHGAHSAVITAVIGDSHDDDYQDVYFSAKRELLTRVDKMSLNQSLNVAHQINQATGWRREDRAKLIFNLISELPAEEGKRCRPGLIYNSYSRKRDALMHVQKQLNEIILNLVFNTINCIHYMHPDGSKEDAIRDYIDEFKLRINALSHYSLKWTREKLRMEWPVTMVNNAFEQLIGETINEHTFDRVAKILKDDLDTRGPGGFLHQVVIHPKTGYTIESNYLGFSATGFSEDYQLRESPSADFIAHIFRVNYHEVGSSTKKATERLESQKESIVKDISSILAVGEETIDAKAFFMRLESVYQMVTPTLYHHALIIYRGAMTHANFDIFSGEATIKNIGNAEMRYVDVVKVATARGRLYNDYRMTIYYFG